MNQYHIYQSNLSHYKVSVKLSKNLRRTLLLMAETRAEALVEAEMFLKNSEECDFLIYEAEEIIPDQLGILFWTDQMSKK